MTMYFYTTALLTVTGDVLEACLEEADSSVLTTMPGFDGDAVVYAEDLAPHIEAWQAEETPTAYALLLAEHGDEITQAIEEYGTNMSFRVAH